MYYSLENPYPYPGTPDKITSYHLGGTSKRIIDDVMLCGGLDIEKKERRMGPRGAHEL